MNRPHICSDARTPFGNPYNRAAYFTMRRLLEERCGFSSRGCVPWPYSDVSPRMREPVARPVATYHSNCTNSRDGDVMPNQDFDQLANTLASDLGIETLTVVSAQREGRPMIGIEATR